MDTDISLASDGPVTLRHLTEHEWDVYTHSVNLLGNDVAPYFVPILRQLRPAVSNCRVAAVDKGWRISLPAKSLSSFSNAKTLTIILREALRVAILQHDRFVRSMMEDELLARVAFDLEINQRLGGMPAPIALYRPDGELKPADYDYLPSDYGLDSAGVAEEFYAALYKEPERDEPRASSGDTPLSASDPAAGSGEDGAEGSLDDEAVNDYADDSAAEPVVDFIDETTLSRLMDALEVQRIDELLKREERNNMLELLRQASNKGAGDGSLEGLLGWVAASDSGNTVDWVSVLRSVLRSCVGSRRRGSVRRSYRRPARLTYAVGNGVLFPSRLASIPNVYVGVDTSASMDSVDGGRVVRNLKNILSEYSNRARVRVAAVDSTVRDFQEVRSLSDVRFVGGGGTDLTAFIRALNSFESNSFGSSEPPANLGILITDGDFDWGALVRELRARHSYRLLILLTGDGGFGAGDATLLDGLPRAVRPVVVPVFPKF